LSRLFKVGTLVRRIRSQGQFTDGGSVDDTDIADKLSSLVAELYSTLDEGGHRHREERLYFTGADMTAAADEDPDEQGAYITLPPDHMATLGVDWRSSGWVELEELMFQERNTFSAGGRTSVAWEHRNDRIYIFGAPSASEKFRLIYVPQPPMIADDFDEVEIDVFTPAGEQFLIFGAVAELKDKEDEDYRFAVQEREKHRERVHVWAVKRSLHKARRPQFNDEYYDIRRSRRGGEYY
jgi:hypothetical protein